MCEYLRSLNFLVVSLSDIVRTEVRHRNKPLTRDVMVHTSNELKAQFGMDVLARRSFHESSEKETHSIAFDSIRNLDEIIYLRDKGVIFLGVDAPIELRYSRVIERARESDGVDFDTFKAHDDRENTGQSPGQNIFRAFQECETIIQNTDTLSALQYEVDQFLATHFARIGTPSDG